jgi:hypothetical protein
VGARVVVRGFTERTRFLNRPRKPYSEIMVGDVLVRVVHKNVLRVGWRPGCSAWVGGRVKREGDRPFLEAEFEGLAHGKGVWEDWLADVARQSYDLYPESIDADWSLATARGGIALRDLLARTSGR